MRSRSATMLQSAAELFSWIVIVAMFAAAAWAWNRVPDRIPVHWNAAGEVDGHGGRFMGLLLIPLVTLGMQLLFLVLPFLDPCRTNYRDFSHAYAVFRTAFIAFMGVIYAATTLVALGHRVDVGMIITVAMGCLFVVMGAFMGDVRPNWFVGIRNPWTLSSVLSWTKTHRLAGRLFLASGSAVIACGIVRPAWGTFVMLATVLPSAIAMTAYSYLVWRHDPDRASATGPAPSVPTSERSGD